MLLDQWGKEIGTGRQSRSPFTVPVNPVFKRPNWNTWGKKIRDFDGSRVGRSRYGAIGAGDRSYTFDANLAVSDGIVPMTVAGWASYAGSPSIIDLGGNQGVTITLPSIAVNTTYTPQQPRIDAVLIVQVTQIIVTNNAYRLILVGSNSPSFSSAAWLGSMELGIGSTLDGYTAGGAAFGNTPALLAGGTPTQFYEVPFTNEQNNVKYEFLGLWLTATGSVPAITFKAFVAELMDD